MLARSQSLAYGQGGSSLASPKAPAIVSRVSGAQCLWDSLQGSPSGPLPPGFLPHVKGAQQVSAVPLPPSQCASLQIHKILCNACCWHQDFYILTSSSSYKHKASLWTRWLTTDSSPTPKIKHKQVRPSIFRLWKTGFDSFAQSKAWADLQHCRLQWGD